MINTQALTIQKDPQSSNIARGSRLEVLRHMTRLTRKQFAEKYGISANTIQSWESGKYGGLTSRGAQRILPIFHAEGIFCTTEWLLHGMGHPPQLTNLQFSGVRETAPIYHLSDVGEVITKELLTFRGLNPNSIDLIVNDDGMEPWYRPADYVAGVQRKGKIIDCLAGQDCIVQTGNNEVLLRRIKCNAQSGLYDLVCINLESQIPTPTLYAQTLVCAAPVIWHRRRDIWPTEKS